MPLWGYILIAVVVIRVGWYFYQRGKKKSSPRNPHEVEAKQRHLDQIMGYLTHNDQVTNDQAQKILNVSDTSAERYLDELEQAGKIVQVGKTGRSVIYKKA